MGMIKVVSENHAATWLSFRLRRQPLVMQQRYQSRRRMTRKIIAAQCEKAALNQLVKIAYRGRRALACVCMP
jgi:hypothetical protein